MAETQLLLNGFSIIGDPQTNTSASGGGNLFVHGGTSVFEADDIVVFTVTNVSVNGVLTGNSIITGITVYDNATDYYHDTAKFTYTGATKISTGRAGMGDRYLEFSADGLTSLDASAPTLGKLAVVAGVDVLGTLGSQNGPLKIPTTEAIDLNGDGVISADEQGDASFSSNLNVLTVVCFAAGTLIETPGGTRPVETLQAGDFVNTLDHGPQQIRWAGGQSVAGVGANAPVHIAAGVLGNIRPLVVSQNHRMLLSGAKAELLFGQDQVLVAAKHLTNDRTIRIVPTAHITYHHFLFDAHQIVFAEGCPAESLYPGAQTLATVPQQDRDEIVALFPDLPLHKGRKDLTRYALRAFEAVALHRTA